MRFGVKFEAARKANKIEKSLTPVRATDTAVVVKLVDTLS